MEEKIKECKFKILNIYEPYKKVMVEFINMDGPLEKGGKKLHDFKIPVYENTGMLNEDGTPIMRILYKYPDNINNNIIMTLDIPYNMRGELYNTDELLKWLPSQYPFDIFEKMNYENIHNDTNNLKSLINKTYSVKVTEDNIAKEIYNSQLYKPTPAQTILNKENSFKNEAAFFEYIKQLPIIPKTILRKFMEEPALKFFTMAEYIRPSDGNIVGVRILNCYSDDSWNCGTITFQPWRLNNDNMETIHNKNDVNSSAKIPLAFKTYFKLSEKYGIPNIEVHELPRQIKFFLPFLEKAFSHIVWPVNEFLTYSVTKYTPLFAKNYKYQMLNYEKNMCINEPILYNNEEYDIEIMDLIKYSENLEYIKWKDKNILKPDIMNIINKYNERVQFEYNKLWTKQDRIDNIFINSKIEDEEKIALILNV